MEKNELTDLDLIYWKYVLEVSEYMCFPLEL